MTWFPIQVEDTGSIPRILRELYGGIVNLEFESLGMSIIEMYHNKKLTSDTSDLYSEGYKSFVTIAGVF